MAIETAEMDFDRALLETKMLLQKRQFGEADRRLKALAARRPDHADVLGLQGMIASERGKPAARREAPVKGLTHDAPPAIYRRNLSIIAALTRGLGQIDLVPQAPRRHPDGRRRARRCRLRLQRRPVARKPAGDTSGRQREAIGLLARVSAIR